MHSQENEISEAVCNPFPDGLMRHTSGKDLFCIDIINNMLFDIALSAI